MLQFNNIKGRKIVLQLHKIFWSGAAPSIDGLIVVADHGQRLFFIDQRLHQFILGEISVLILIDQKVANTFLPFSQYLRLFLEEHNWNHNQVIKIHSVIGF